MTAAATDEAWIQGSLARLETLEAQREQLAASGQTGALAEVDEEIRALYEVLESAAGEAAEQPPANMGMAPPMGAAPQMGMAPPMGAAPQMGMAPPMGAAPQMGMAPPMGAAPQMGMAPPMGMAAAPGYDGFDDDIKPPRSALPFVLIGLLVVGGGVAGFMVLNKEKPAEAPANTEPALVIKSGAVEEDTQEPQVAKGGDADRVEGSTFKERPPGDDPTPRRPSSGSSSSSRPRTPKKDDGRKIEVTNSRDPLAGID